MKLQKIYVKIVRFGPKLRWWVSSRTAGSVATERSPIFIDVEISRFVAFKPRSLLHNVHYAQHHHDAPCIRYKPYYSEILRPKYPTILRSTGIPWLMPILLRLLSIPTRDVPVIRGLTFGTKYVRCGCLYEFHSTSSTVTRSQTTPHFSSFTLATLLNLSHNPLARLAGTRPHPVHHLTSRYKRNYQRDQQRFKLRPKPAQRLGKTAYDSYQGQCSTSTDSILILRKPHILYTGVLDNYLITSRVCQRPHFHL